MGDFEKVLKNYRFLALWISQILSQLTVNILSFVILIHLFEQTGSTIASSLLWVAYAVPAIIFGPIAAAWVDLVEKRRVLMVANGLQAFVVILYAILLYKKLIYLSYTVVFLYSLFNQFYVPAEAASLPLFVSKDDLPSANGLFFITQQSSLVLGFGMAGVLDQIFGFRPTLILVAICLFFAFVSVSFLPEKKPSTKFPKSFEKGFSKFFEQIIEGYNFIKNTREVLFPFLLLLGVQVILAVIVVNLPRLSTDIVHISPGSSGFLVVVPAGIGAILGTLAITKLIGEKIEKKQIILASVSMLALAILVAGLIVPYLNPQWVRVLVSVILFVFAGLGAVGTLVPSITILQEKTPKDLLGRVFGNFWFLTTLATVIPVLFSATITDLLGVQFLFIILGMACWGVVIFSYYKLKNI